MGSTNARYYHLITFDPGSAATGWAYSITDCRAFSRPNNVVEEHIETFDCGEFRGSEYEQVAAITASLIIPKLAYGCDFVSEDFELTQTHGGDDLLSPVRINAMISWELYQQKYWTGLQYQKRSLRTGVTREIATQWMNRRRLRFRKDEFAAVQHNITWLRRLKQKANQVPWKINGKWDCSCEDGDSCNLIHP